jgi:hypothetical protein
MRAAGRKAIMMNPARKISAHLRRLREVASRVADLLPFRRTRAPHRLRLCENLQLGERRFLSVVECGQQRFLLGGTASALSLLAVLPAPESKHHEEPPAWKFVAGEMIRELGHG